MFFSAVLDLRARNMVGFFVCNEKNVCVHVCVRVMITSEHLVQSWVMKIGNKQ